MIFLYQGTPGSGKSFHATQRIYYLLRNGNANIICNFPVNVERVFLTKRGYRKQQLMQRFPKLKLSMKSKDFKPVTGHFCYWENSEMTIDRLKQFCFDHHRYREIMLDGVPQRAYYEDQTLIVIDEAQILFNCREWGDKKRQEWCKFFSQHRHYGFDFILIAQHERMLDRQIRYLIEIYVDHRNIKYFNWFAKLICLFTGGSLFLCLFRWQGCKDIMRRECSRFNERIAGIYNSYLTFDSRPEPDTDAGQGSLRPGQGAGSCTKYGG